MASELSRADRIKALTPVPIKRAVRRVVLDRLVVRRPLVPEQELRDCFTEALQRVAVPRTPTGSSPTETVGPLGDYVEFGVCRGTSMACMADATRALGLGEMRLIGFDSFEGLPVEVEDDDGGVWRRGQFKMSEAGARRFLRGRGVELDRVTLVAGWFDETATPETARRLAIEEVSVAMIDCDAYSSARTALAFLGPLLGERAVLVFDDWHSLGLSEVGEGEKRAFEEWLDETGGFEVVERLEPYAANAEVLLVARR